MKPVALDYARARSIDEALDLLAAENGNGKVYAGGQSIGPMLNLRLVRPAKLIDIRHIAALRAIEGDDQSVAIGATWTHAEIEDGAVEDPTRGLLPFVARGIAYRAVRNRGTVGGSLAHADPAADWVSTMAGIGASIEIRGSGPKSRHVTADAFLAGAFTSQLAANEILFAIRVPRFSSKARWGYHKVCRKTGEFAKAIGISVQDPRLDLHRVVAGALNGRPLLLSQTSERLKREGPEQAASLARDEIDATLAHLDGAHRQQLAIAVRRSLSQLASPKGD